MRDLGLSWNQAGLVVLSSIGIYVSFIVLIRLVGQRALSSMASYDFAAAVALGAIIGRVVLGYTPTLLAGIIGLTTLFAMQALFGFLRRDVRIDRTMTNLPMLLMAHGEPVEENMRKARVVEDELRSKLRLAGIRRYSDVEAVILERTGAISVLRQGEAIAPELLADVTGADILRAGTA